MRPTNLGNILGTQIGGIYKLGKYSWNSTPNYLKTSWNSTTSDLQIQEIFLELNSV